jgi:hypothetical protein
MALDQGGQHFAARSAVHESAEAQSIDQMEIMLRQAADELAAMKVDGVTLEPARSTTDDYAVREAHP